MRSTNQIFRKNVNKLRNYSHRFYGDILPSSEVVIIKSNSTKNKDDDNLKKGKLIEESNMTNNSKEFRVNEVNIQMISKNIYKQLFKNPDQRVDTQVIKR